MKRILIILLSLIIAFLVGCGSSTTIEEPDKTDEQPTIDDIIKDEDPLDKEEDGEKDKEDTIDEQPTIEEPTYSFPNFYVNTENGKNILSKEVYVKSLISINNSEYVITDEDAGIRGRGNSTWAWDKKPYRVKFDSKVNLFNNGKAKSWTLIANHCDLSLSRNYLAFAISRNTDDLEFTSSTQFVNLYLNGEYRGVYLVCDQIQTGKTRVNVNEKLNGRPEETGYLIEMDVADRVKFEGGVEGKDFFTLGTDTSKAYVLKTPDTDDSDYSVEYLNYIRNYMSQVYTYLTSKATAINYSILSSLIDVNTFADSYIVSELFNNCDVGWSMYMYKDANGLLKSGPVWDFDISSGNCAYHPKSCNPTNMWARGGSAWYVNLFRFPEFRQLVTTKMKIYKERFTQLLNEEVDNLLLYEEEFNKNFEKWNILGKGVKMGDTQIATDELLALNTWKDHIIYLKEWLLDSLDAMAIEYSE